MAYPSLRRLLAFAWPLSPSQTVLAELECPRWILFVLRRDLCVTCVHVSVRLRVRACVRVLFVRAWLRACVTACVPVCLRACVPVCLRAYQPAVPIVCACAV